MAALKVWLLMGPPGSGKGTQAQALARDSRLWHVSTGDILRQVVQSGSELGQKVQGIIQSGRLVDDKTMLEVLRNVLTSQKPASAQWILLDGYPRTLEQWRDLQQLCADLAFSIEGTLWLDCSDDVLLERLSGRLVCRDCQAVYHKIDKPPLKEGVCDLCGGRVVSRPDDRPEVVAHRLNVYRNQTMPLKEVLSQQPRFWVIPCDRPREQIFKQMTALMGLS